MLGSGREEMSHQEEGDQRGWSLCCEPTMVVVSLPGEKECSSPTVASPALRSSDSDIKLTDTGSIFDLMVPRRDSFCVFPLSTTVSNSPFLILSLSCLK